jgi:hypothetical protein
LSKARLADRRKSEDELTKGFLQRRQQAASTLVQRLQQFTQGLERVRNGTERPPSLAMGAITTAARTPMAAKLPVAAVGVGETGATAATVRATQSLASPVTALAKPPVKPVEPVRSPAMERLAALAKLGQQRNVSSADAKVVSATPVQPGSPGLEGQEGMK